MENYEALEIEVIVFDAADVNITSDGVKTPRVTDSFDNDLYLE